MKWIILGVLLLFLFSGCIGGDSTGVAHQLQESRTVRVPDGLLTPTTPALRENYRNELIEFRSPVRNIGGNDGTALRAYLDGSLALLSMQDSAQDGLILLESVDPSFITCENGTPATKAIERFQEAKKYSQEAFDYFTRVQQNASMANALGADYVINVVKTTEILITVNTERVDQLKSACGYSV